MADDRVVPIAPVWASQLNCLAALGIDDRRFRETVRALGITHVRRGKLVLVRLTDWDEAMRRAQTAGVEPTEDDSVDSVLAVLGRRRAG